MERCIKKKLSFSIEEILADRRLLSPADDHEKERISHHAKENKTRQSMPLNGFCKNPETRPIADSVFSIKNLLKEQRSLVQDTDTDKALKMQRRIIPLDKRLHLEELFLRDQYIDPVVCEDYSIKLGLSEFKIKTWFQNRRSKERKLKRKILDSIHNGSSLTHNFTTYGRGREERYPNPTYSSIECLDLSSYCDDSCRCVRLIEPSVCGCCHPEETKHSFIGRKSMYPVTEKSHVHGSSYYL